MKPEPLQNPFVKVPAKYYDSMGDFYKSPKWMIIYLIFKVGKKSLLITISQSNSFPH